MSHCLYCDARLSFELTWREVFFPVAEKVLCSECEEKLERLQGELCQVCGRGLDGLDADFVSEQVCHDCLRWEKSSEWKGILEKNTSLYVYNDFLREMLARYKFRGDYALVKVFGEGVGRMLKEVEYDRIVPIPLSSERLRERGFNQAMGLAQAAGAEQQVFDCLTRVKSEKQSKKSRRERLAQVQPFQLKEKAEESIQGKRILLLDDVYTTGTTLRHAAKLLKQVGAHSITSLTLARS